MYAKTVDEYKTLEEQFDKMDKSETTKNYFDNNWRNCTDKWVHAYRKTIQCPSAQANENRPYYLSIINAIM